MARRAKAKSRKGGKGPARRNPLAPHLRRRGHAVLPSARHYRRRPKHKKPPQGEGT